MKNFLSTIVILLYFTSCKPTSGIITSKDMAEKKGLYFTSVVSKSPASQPEVSLKKENVVKANKKTSQAKKNNQLNEKNDNDIYADTDNTSYLVKQLINSASDNLGIGYRGGGINKSGFDCSGLMYSTFKNYDITLPRSSYEMAEIGRKLDQKEIKKGDLIFFKTNGRSRINHVGMVVEINDAEIKFIHSSTQSGVIISSTKEAYYKKTFAQVNRVLE